LSTDLYSPPPLNEPPPRGPSRKWRWWVAIGVVLLLLVAGVTIVLVTRHSTPAAAAELYLEPSDSTGASPFTSTVAAPPVPQPLPQPSVSPPINPSPSASPTSSQLSVLPISGATPGLYGGTQNQATCDRNQMANFLTANPDKAIAWAAAMNTDPSLRWSGGTQLTASQIPQYLNELTPIRLLADTRVTNNGYVNGHPTPHQSVLQAGTAVFVDQYGVPRARCACGNPLQRSIPLTSSSKNVGTPWSGYGHAVVINQSTTIINNYTLINITNGTPFTQPSGGGTVPIPGNPAPVPTVTVTVTAPCPSSCATTPPYSPLPSSQPTARTTPVPAPTPRPTLSVPPSISLGTGDVQATLLWNGDSDLDLHVTDPSGTDIYYGNDTSSTGGKLDHDDIPHCGDSPATHVENIFWPTGGAPSGQYKVYVVDFRQCPGASSSFEMRVTVGGRVVYDQSGSLTATDQQSSGYAFTR